MPHQVDQRLAQVALLVQPQVLAGDRVAPLDMAMGVEQDDAIGQGQAGVAKALQLALELLLPFAAHAHETVEPDQHLFPDAAPLRHRLRHGIAQPVLQRRQLGHMAQDQQRSPRQTRASAHSVPASGQAIRPATPIAASAKALRIQTELN